MGRPLNSTVRHGMASCARYGCERPECCKARRAAHRNSANDMRQGTPARVSSVDATTHAKALLHAGMSPLDMAERSGVSASRVMDILKGRSGLIYRVTEEALLGISVPVDGWEPTGDSALDGTGTIRRLQALSVQGYPLTALMAETGLARATICDLRSGRRVRVMLSGMLAVRDAHDRLWDVDPIDAGVSPEASVKVKTWARKNGWLPSEAWSDIDDSECEPVLKTFRYVALTEDFRELEKMGYNRKDAAERLGVSISTLEKAIGYYNRKEST